MGLNPDKMEELKEKYGITDDVIFEIADAVEPDPEVPPGIGAPNMGKTGGFTPPSGGYTSESIASAMRGDISIAEAIILMDYMDRKDDRRERRSQPTQDNSYVKELIQEMREERKEYRDSIEHLILSRRAEDAEEKAARAEAEKEEVIAAQRQREIVEGAVQGAVGQIEEAYGKKLNTLASRVAALPENQRKGFWDELFTDFETDLKGEFKELVLGRLKAPVKPITKTDEEGKTAIDWSGIADRGEKILDKILDARKEAPPRVPVNEIPTEPGGAPRPLDEGPPETIEAEYEEVEEGPEEAPEQEVEVTPLPPQDIAGIGPARAKELQEIGISDARQLAIVGPRHLADSLSISKEKAEDIIKQAKDLVDQS